LDCIEIFDCKRQQLTTISENHAMIIFQVHCHKQNYMSNKWCSSVNFYHHQNCF